MIKFNLFKFPFNNGVNKKTEVASYKKYELFQQQWTDEDDANVKIL